MKNKERHLIWRTDSEQACSKTSLSTDMGPVHGQHISGYRKAWVPEKEMRGNELLGYREHTFPAIIFFISDNCKGGMWDWTSNLNATEQSLSGTPK
jgi:hypothetical protein